MNENVRKIMDNTEQITYIEEKAEELEETAEEFQDKAEELKDHYWWKDKKWQIAGYVVAGLVVLLLLWWLFSKIFGGSGGNRRLMPVNLRGAFSTAPEQQSQNAHDNSGSADDDIYQAVPASSMRQPLTVMTVSK